MQAQHHSHHGCGSQSRGPKVFYGYCHDTNRMRMMDYTDYMKNMQTGYSNLYSNPAAPMQPMFDALSNIMGGTGTAGQTYHKHGRGCGCRDCDCGCTCCIRC